MQPGAPRASTAQPYPSTAAPVCVDIPDSASLDLTNGLDDGGLGSPDHVKLMAHRPYEGADRGSGLWTLCQ